MLEYHVKSERDMCIGTVRLHNMIRMPGVSVCTRIQYSLGFCALLDAQRSLA